jgi:hypothetical protein
LSVCDAFFVQIVVDGVLKEDSSIHCRYFSHQAAQIYPIYSFRPPPKKSKGVNEKRNRLL